MKHSVIIAQLKNTNKKVLGCWGIKNDLCQTLVFIINTSIKCDLVQVMLLYSIFGACQSKEQGRCGSVLGV